MGKDTTTKHLFDDGYTIRSYTSGGYGSTYTSGSSGSFLDSVSAYGASVAQRERAYWHPETTGPDKRMEKRNEKQREKLKQEDWLERAA